MKGLQVGKLDPIEEKLSGTVAGRRRLLCGSGFCQSNQIGGIQLKHPAEAEEGIQFRCRLVPFQF